jgi:VWFA-related protein
MNMKDQFKLSALAYLLVVVFIVSGNQNVLAQSTTPAPAQTSGKFRIDLQVLDRKGGLVQDLKAGDITLLVDKQPVKLDEFRVVESTVVKSFDPSDASAPAKVSSEPAQVIIVLDAVNMYLQQVNLVQEQLKRYLLSNDAKMAAPTQLVFYKSSGIELGPMTMDGNALLAALEKQGPMLRTQRSSQGDYGNLERYQTSLKRFLQLEKYFTKLPGKKVMLWLGPGWPIIPSDYMQFNAEFQNGNYQIVTEQLNQLRENRMTVYSVRPDSGNEANTYYFEQFLKPVKKKQDVNAGDLAVQVLAVESGGRVTEPSNDMAKAIADCVQEAGSYYSLSFTPVVSGKALTYHSIEVKVNRPDVKVRTTTGYYETGPSQ